MLEFDTQNINLGLERVTEVLHRLGNPHLKFKSIQVAGTNGKGSVCAMLDSILRESGLRVGLFTSPHLFRFNERVRVQGDDIPEREMAEGLARIKRAAEGLNLTTFELITCLAFDHFARQKVDMAVVEVGMGGRLDATNVIVPEVAVITNVELDHTEYLGETLEKIAAEKAGIIKPGIPLVTAEEKPEVLRVIEKTCQSRDARCWILGKEARLEARSQLLGSYQRKNEAVAVKVAELLKIGPAVIERGLRKTRWPGRFQLIGDDPPVILDGAHNVAGAQALLETIKELKIERPLTLVLGIQGYKDVKGILAVLAPLADKLIVTRSSHPQAAHPMDLASHVPQNTLVLYSLVEALSVARGFDHTTVVTGSLFVVAEALKQLTLKPR